VNPSDGGLIGSANVNLSYQAGLTKPGVLICQQTPARRHLVRKHSLV